MGITLTDTEELKKKLLDEEYHDVRKIIILMKHERICLQGWELFEIPGKKIYCFFNKTTNEAFDFEPINSQYKGGLRPHYYQSEESIQVAAHTIKEAIEKYEFINDYLEASKEDYWGNY
ncbi:MULTISPECIES: hypothetical protein [Lactococcus]|uniref:hypothetical protein n=1 Tax=Lactococcus TaxID=1357 RepID=UPI002435AFF0|nr:hypothetical protein [Lactococcus formosensis]MDG6143762.1 hypothetical protein [Lactococcus formosensis]